MRTEISKTFRLESAHFLPHVPDGHKCKRVHGHSFHVTLHVGGELDSTLGWIVDFADIERAWQPVHQALDHRLLNEVAGLENPTSELLAKWVLEHVELPRGTLTAVTIEETCTSRCTVFAETRP